MVGAHVATVIFIRAHVSSCTAPLSVPTQHKRTHQLGLVALASISSSYISFLLQQLFFLMGGKQPLQLLQFLHVLWFSSVFEDWGSAVVLTEILLCPRSTKSLILNTLCQFLPLQETNVQLEPPLHPPSTCPLALWNCVPFAFEVLRVEWRFFAW